MTQNRNAVIKKENVRWKRRVKWVNEKGKDRM